MDRDELAQYEAQERRYARTHGEKAVDRGIVKRIEAVYEDLVLPDSFGVHRKGAPLQILALLYPATVVFLPPTTKPLLERRLGMRLKDLIKLCDSGVVKPLIGHPVEYADLPHFDPILRSRPPSVWARGDEIAHRFADAGRIWDDARRLLPLDSIGELGWVRDRWAVQYPHLRNGDLTKQIHIEVCTNYVDLCIFGWENAAGWLLDYAEPDMIVKRLLELNEVATYPYLLGVGGTPNYGVQDRQLINGLRAELLLPTPVQYVGPEMDLLLKGLRLSFPKMIGAEAVMKFHKDGIGQHVWSALHALEEEIGQHRDLIDPGNVVDASSEAQAEIQKALAAAKSIAYDTAHRKLEDTVGLGVKAATMASIGIAAVTTGALSPLAAFLASVGAGGLFATQPFAKYSGKVEERISDWLLSKKFTPLATHLWWIENWQSSLATNDSR